MIQFHGVDELRVLLPAAASMVRIQPLTVAQRVDLFGASFPGLITLPPRLRPTDYYLFLAQR